MINQIAPMLIK